MKEHLKQLSDPANKQGGIISRNKKIGDLPQNGKELLDQYHQSNFNPIQKCIVSMLKDFTEKEPEKVVTGFLKIWEEHMEISTKNQDEIHKSNEVCEKVVQLLLCLQVPAHTVINAINVYIDEEQGESIWGTREDEQQNLFKAKINERQSSICQFVYTYLMHNIQYISIKSNIETRATASEGVAKEDEFKDEKIKLYHQVIEMVDKFKKARHPNTTLWLIEILHILTNKFTPSSGMSNEKSLAKKLEGLLQYLLKLCGILIEDKGEIIYHHSWNLGDIHLNPTVYEMLKRFEFCLQKREDFGKNPDYDEDGILMTDEQTYEMDMSNILDLAERGIGSGARGENENLNLQYTANQLYNYSSIPNFKETIYEELEADWQESRTGENMNITFRYMSELRNLIHNKKDSNINMSEAFRVCVIVTIRQTLTQLTTQIHSRALADRDLDNKRKKSESIIVNAALNIID